MWDKSGQLWKSIQEKWQDLVPVYVEPRKTDFQVGNNRLQVELEQARVISVDPERSLEHFARDARDFIKLTTDHLHISVYKRVGFRLVYFKEFKSRADAAAAVFSLKLLRLPDGKRFEVEEPPVDPMYSLRWESEKKGVFVNVRAEVRKFDVEPSPEAARLMSAVHSETSGVVFDVDYYTVAPVETGQMDVAEWIKHAVHVIARDSKYVFEA